MPKPKISEHMVQRAFFDYVRVKAEEYGPTSAWNPYNMIAATPNQGAKGRDATIHTQALKREGLAKGFPDISVLVPTPYSCGLFIELKIKTGQSTLEQRRWVSRLCSFGYIAGILKTDSPKKLIQLVEAYLQSSSQESFASEAEKLLFLSPWLADRHLQNQSQNQE